MTTYADTISSAAGTKKYPGGMLTNTEAHEWTAKYATELNDNASGLVMPEEAMKGAAADAARSVFESTRRALQEASDHLNNVASAAKSAAPAIESGVAGDAAVKAACADSAAAYRAAAGGGPEIESGDEAVIGEPDGSGKAPGEGKTPSESEGKPEAPTGTGPARTETSADKGDGAGAKPQSPGSASPGSQAPSGSPQPQQGAGSPMAATMPSAAGQQAAAGAQQPGGMPMNASPRTSTGSPSGPGRDGYQQAIRDAIRESGGTGNGSTRGPIPRGVSPRVDPSGSDGGAVVAAPVPVGNPSVTGGAADPSQTSGRTASTTVSGAPGAGMKPAPTGMPMGGGMMGGMGAMGQGMGHQSPPAANGGAPRIKRDKDTEAVLDGTAARDKALIGSILTDDDLIATSGEDVEDGDEDLLADQRNDGPRRSEEPGEDERW
ncbi:hypothetical protein [Tsukamurella pulmonis]|uniref:hypothetical protein n=1 Tax=Tsukamurella pulmonis TaxID=47312 RepID=UPI0014032B4D|nr:hypothetical protein [Tsukamurella pulmonis]